MQNSKNLTIGIIIAALVVVAGLVIMNNNNDDEIANNSSNNSSQQQSDNKEQKEEAKDIVGLASETEALSTLVTAVKAAELVETLQGEGPFTVFAPTNDAFAALPAGTLDTLLKPESKESLKGILTYHVVAGKVMAADLKDGQEVTTVQGGKLTVKLMDGKAYLIDAKGTQVAIAATDIAASNGVVHVISGVLMP